MYALSVAVVAAAVGGGAVELALAPIGVVGIFASGYSSITE